MSGHTRPITPTQIELCAIRFFEPKGAALVQRKGGNDD